MRANFIIKVNADSYAEMVADTLGSLFKDKGMTGLELHHHLERSGVYETITKSTHSLYESLIEDYPKLANRKEKKSKKFEKICMGKIVHFVKNRYFTVEDRMEEYNGRPYRINKDNTKLTIFYGLFGHRQSVYQVKSKQDAYATLLRLSQLEKKINRYFLAAACFIALIILLIRVV